MWAAEGVTQIWQRVEQLPLFPLGPSPTYSGHSAERLPHPGEHLRLHPLLRNRHAETKKKKAQIKEQIKAPGKIQLSNEEIANLSDAQFKTLVMKMLQELTGYFNSIKKIWASMKVALCEKKKNTGNQQ